MIRFYHGFFFPLMSQIFCGLLLIASFFVAMEYPLPGFILIFFFGLSFATHKGIEFDMQQNRFRSYTSIYGIKFGKWLALSDYPHICLLHRHYVKKPIYSKYQGNYNTNTFEGQYAQIEVIITGEDFRKKILVKTEKTEERGRSEAERIAKLLGKSFVNYAPKRHPNNPRKKRSFF